MSASQFPLRYALLAAALVQLLPATAYAAKADKDDKGDNGGAVCEDCPDYSGWSKWLELGIGVQSDDAYHFGRYTGLQDEGGFVNANGEVRYRAKSNGGYMNAKVTDLGLDSRNVRVEAGRQGKYGLAVEYDQVPNYRKQYTGASLRTERDRVGVKFSVVPGKDWEVSGFYRHEEKEGTRDVGATFGFAPTAILPVAFNYQTEDFGVSLGYRGERLQAQLAYAGSLFDGGRSGIPVGNTLPPGQIAEAPDNQSHQISALLGYQLTERTRLGAKLSFGHLTQDQTFLPYSTNPGIVTAALPTSNLNGEVDTTLAQLSLNSRPSPRLRLDASYTYSNRDNTTPVNTYTYVITDIALGPDARTNRPYSFEQNLLRLKAGYRLPKDMDLSGGFDYDKMDRSYQQVTETEDRTLWAKLKFNPADAVETTLKVSHADRNASPYNAAAFQNPSFPESGAVPGDPLMQAFEMADRTRDKVGFDVAYNPGEKLTLGFALDYYKDDYKNMVLGLTQASGLTLTPSLSYVISENLSASAYYTYDKLNSDQAGRDWISLPPISVPWAESDSNKTQTVGIGVNWKAIPKKLDVGADVVHADFSGKIRYPGSIDLPELTSTLTALGVHGTYKLKDNVSLRADYRYERYKESDWAYLAFPTPLLGTTPQDQEVHMIYLSVRYAFK
jgi:MtrB/PioB family decaheme-associated outer membrane protein